VRPNVENNRVRSFAFVGDDRLASQYNLLNRSNNFRRQNYSRNGISIDWPSFEVQSGIRLTVWIAFPVGTAVNINVHVTHEENTPIVVLDDIRRVSLPFTFCGQ